MKQLENQLRRLLRAAAAVPAEKGIKPSRVPSARWLLSQREARLIPVAASIRPVLQGGLAVACVLLVITLAVNLRLIDQANQDVFAVSKAALTRVSTP